MAQRFGGKIVTDGLVLCLDAHDAKSYAGEPITNMAYNIGILGHGSTWEAITSVPGSEGQTGPGANVNFKKLNDNSVANTFLNSNGKIFRNYVNNPATSDSSSFNNNGGFRYASSINLTSGGASGYVIISFWCYLVTGYQGYGGNGLPSSYMQFQNSGGTYTGNGSKSFYVDGVSKTTNETFNGDTGRWKFVQIRFTKPANSTAIRNFYIYSDRNTQGEMYVCQLQIEDRSDSGFYQVPFVEGASSRSATDGWVDRSGNSNSGTLVNGTNTGVTNYRDGQVIMPVANSYLDFDGSDDYVDLTSHSSAFDFGTSNFSVEAWVNGTVNSNFRCIFFHHYSPGFTLITTSGQSPDGAPRFWLGGSVLNGTTSILDGTWHHVLVTRNGATVTIYIDGSQNVSNAGFSGKSATPTTAQAAIGRYTVTSSSYPFDGKIALVRIYSDALTAAEVLSNYNTVKPRFGL